MNRIVFVIRTFFAAAFAAVTVFLCLPALAADEEIIQTQPQQLISQALEEVNQRPKLALELSTKALILMQPEAPSDTSITALAIKAQALRRLGELDNALAVIEEADRILKAIPPSKKSRADILATRGRIYADLGRIADALTDLREALELRHELGDIDDIVMVLSDLAIIYTSAQEHTRSAEYLERAREISRGRKAYTTARVLNNLAYVYINLNDAEKALTILEEGRALAVEINNPLSIAYTFESTGEALSLLNRHEEAEAYLTRGLADAEKLGLHSLQSNAYHYLAHVALSRGDLDGAYNKALQARDIGERVNDIDALRDVHHLLANIQRRRGLYEDALAHMDEHLKYKEAVENVDFKRRLSLHNAEFLTKEKERELALLQSEHEVTSLRLARSTTLRNMLMFGGLFFVVITILLGRLLSQTVSANKRARQKTQELLATQTELRNANRMKSQILAIASHEVRTPLNGMIGMAQILLRTELSPDQRRFAETILSSGDILLALLNDILDMSKIESGHLDIVRENFALAQLVDGLNNLWRLKAEDKGLSFNVVVDPALPGHLSGDAHRLRQVLSNLVSNAIKFTDKGSVTVTFSQVDGDRPDVCMLRVAIADTGFGITSEQKRHIFEPFRQAHEGISRKFGGTGLGLSICRQLIELMKGRMDVESTPGVGSTFWFEVPCGVGVESELKIPQQPQLSDATLQALKGAKVLVAEDNELNQMVINHLLRPSGLDLKFVGDGRQAVEEMLVQSYDLVLMDVHMPILDGISAAKEIRALPPPSCDTPILALSADAIEDDHGPMKEASFNGYITKPIDAVKLCTTIANLLTPELVANNARQRATH